MRKGILRRLSPCPGGTASNSKIHSSVEPGHITLAPLIPDTRSPLHTGSSLVRAVPQNSNQPFCPFYPVGMVLPWAAPHSVCPVPPHSSVTDNCGEPRWPPQGLLLGVVGYLSGVCYKENNLYILLLAIPTEQHEGINLREKGFNTGSCIFIIFLSS